MEFFLLEIFWYRDHDAKKIETNQNQTKQTNEKTLLFRYLWTWVKLEKNSFSMVWKKGNAMAIRKLNQLFSWYQVR